MRYLITGGAGFIGSTLCEGIIRDGGSVVVVDNFNDFYDYNLKIENVLCSSSISSEKKKEFLKLVEENNKDVSKVRKLELLKSFVDSDKYTLEVVDIRDLEGMRRVVRDIDIVVHLAAMAGVRPSIEDPLLYEEVNVRGTNILLEVMKENNIKKLLAASSSSVYGNNKSVPFKESDIVDFAISPYAATKKANEVMCHTYHHLYNMDIVMLRFFTVFGPRQRPDLAIYKFTKLILGGEEIPFFGNGETSRDYTYVDDIVAGIMLLGEYIHKKEKIYEIVNIGGSDPVSLKEMVETIESVTERKAHIKRLPMQPGDVERTFADTNKLRALVGYSAVNSFRDGVEKFYAWYKENRM